MTKEKTPLYSNEHKIKLTESAQMQMSLILENDFTLSGKYLRVLVSGKGCDGFTYSVGFTDLANDDVIIRSESSMNLELIMDPFTAFYLKNGVVDYVQDFANNNEGFVIENLNQKEFSGKFWKQAPEKVPQFAEGTLS